MHVRWIATGTTWFPGWSLGRMWALTLTVSALLLSGCRHPETPPGSGGKPPQSTFDTVNHGDRTAPIALDTSESAAVPRVNANEFHIKSIRVGMAEAEVEQLLGGGEATDSPVGNGMPKGIWTSVEGESVFIACTYRRWHRGGKSYVSDLNRPRRDGYP